MRDSTAPLFAPEDNRPDPVLEAAPPKPRAVPYQPSLFQEMGNVIPFRSPETVASPKRTPRKRSSPKAVKNEAADRPESLSFNFEMPGEEAWLVERGLGASAIAGRGSNLIGEPVRAPESDIYCDAPVAPVPARMIAVVFDLALATAAYAPFATAYWFLARSQPVLAPAPGTWKVAVPYAVLFVIVALLYKILWISAGTESPGAQWTRLRVVSFDGEPASKRDLLRRMGWWIFGTAAVGLGHMWALVDEEGLTWHDLLSKTFVTIDPRR